MNQLITINYAPTLTNDERKFIECGVGKRVKELDKYDLSSFLVELLTKIKFEAGHKPEILKEDEYQKLVAVVNSVYNDIKNYFSTLTKNDIQHAFHLGVRKEYGEYMGINPVTIFQWLRCYAADAKRMEAKKKQAAYLESLNSPKKLTEEEKYNIMNDAVKKAFEIVKSGKYFDDIGNAVYNYLDKKAKINFTKERKDGIVNLARVACKERYLNKLHYIKDSFEKNAIKEALKNIETQVTPDIIIEAKRIALNQYFSELIEMDLNLEL